MPKKVLSDSRFLPLPPFLKGISTCHDLSQSSDADVSMTRAHVNMTRGLGIPPNLLLCRVLNTQHNQMTCVSLKHTSNTQQQKIAYSIDIIANILMCDSRTVNYSFPDEKSHLPCK